MSRPPLGELKLGNAALDLRVGMPIDVKDTEELWSEAEVIDKRLTFVDGRGVKVREHNQCVARRYLRLPYTLPHLLPVVRCSLLPLHLPLCLPPVKAIKVHIVEVEYIKQFSNNATVVFRA